MIQGAVPDAEHAPSDIYLTLDSADQRPQGDCLGGTAKFDSAARAAKRPDQACLTKPVDNFGQVSAGEFGFLGDVINGGELSRGPARKVKSGLDGNLGSVAVNHHTVQYKNYSPYILLLAACQGLFSWSLRIQLNLLYCGIGNWALDENGQVRDTRLRIPL